MDSEFVRIVFFINQIYFLVFFIFFISLRWDSGENVSSVIHSLSRSNTSDSLRLKTNETLVLNCSSEEKTNMDSSRLDGKPL